MKEKKLRINKKEADILKKNFLISLENNLGIVTNACKEVGLNRKTYYYWYTNDEEFKKQVEDIQEITLDFVENSLYRNIKNGSEKSILFYLRNKAKHRGYVDETNINANIETAPIKIIFGSETPSNKEEDDEDDNNSEK